MAHQVLARKWRPRDFASLIGQDHVVRALSHALDNDRLHHAYLFTGTRGVGKTTLARIVAKAVNCETGVSSRPCGTCRACKEIDEGRFVDYLELDAASNRGVDEMAQLLENAVYAPSAGRYKVYVIDEVHMLSNHAFNAMLKTLEEPPGHVLFVLATTDPQRVPVTVLSRCMQLNLKNMLPIAVAGHLATVLDAEEIAYETPALSLLGRAAAGSMRDALSLLDQAIAFGGGRVDEVAVREMLGVVDRHDLARLLDALLVNDGAGLIALADEMAVANAPFDRALAELAALLQRVAVAAVAPPDEAEGDAALVIRLAGTIAAEDLQAWYQIAIHGRRDLALAPDPATGFSMTLLRLLAFRAESGSGMSSGPAQQSPVRAEARKPAPPEDRSAAPRFATDSARAAVRAAAGLARPRPGALGRARGGRAEPVPPPARSDQSSASPDEPGEPVSSSPVESSAADAARAGSAAAGVRFDGNWPELAERISLSGLAAQFMQQSELTAFDDSEFRVRLPIRNLGEPAITAKVRAALAEYLGVEVQLKVEIGPVQGVTAAQLGRQRRDQQTEQARRALDEDPFVRTLIDDFNGAIVPGSVSPVEPAQDNGEDHA